MTLDDDALLSYVQLTAPLLALPLDAQRAQRVAQHLARTAALAALLEEVPLRPEDEPAEIYCPAAFVDTPREGCSS